MSLEIILLAGLYFLAGYSGGWLFRNDNYLIQRYGMFIAFFIVYFLLWGQITAAIFLGAAQDWLQTAPYIVGFIYRFFRHG